MSQTRIPSLKQTNSVLHQIDLTGALRDISIKISLSQSVSDPQYWQKQEAIIGEAWEAQEAQEAQDAAIFNKGDRVQVDEEPFDEVGVVVEGPYNNPRIGPNTYTVNWPSQGMKLSDASELKPAPTPTVVTEADLIAVLLDAVKTALKAGTEQFHGNVEAERQRVLTVLRAAIAKATKHGVR